MARLSWLDRIFYRVRLFTRQWKSTILSSAMTLLVAVLVQILSTPAIKWADVRGEMLKIDRPLNLLFYLSVLAVLLIYLIDWGVEKYYSRRRYEVLLAELIGQKIDPIIAPYAKGQIAWGKAMSLFTHHDPHEGWMLHKIRVKKKGQFSFPSRLKSQLESFRKKDQRFIDDRQNFGLSENKKFVSSDSPTPELVLRETQYSEVKFYQENIIRHDVERNNLMRKLMQGDIEFPNTLSMHAVVITKDGKILLTLSHPNKGYYPNVWSVSVEEQLSPLDFTDGTQKAVLKWGKRFLAEELKVTDQDYDERALRILSVFLEGDILNCALCAVFPLTMTEFELDKFMKNPKIDYEFVDWKFWSWREMSTQLFHPMLPLHPTSGYRMLLALAYKHGIPELAEKLLSPQ